MQLIPSYIVDRLPLPVSQSSCTMPHRIVPLPNGHPPKKKLKYHQPVKIENARVAGNENQVAESGKIIIPSAAITAAAGATNAAVFGIISDDGGSDSKQFHLDISNTKSTLTTHSLEGLQLRQVKDMYFHPQISLKSTDQALEKSLSTCRKNQAALKSILSFLDTSSSCSTINQSSIFERFLFGSSSTPHVNSFASTTFSFPDIKDTQYLHIRGSPPPSPLSSYKSLSIITSICLFSADAVSSLSSQLLDLYTHYPYSNSLHLHHPLTFNELDSLSRLSNTIADVICSISSSSSSPHSSQNIKIILDIPQIQYYLSGPISHFHIPAISKTWLSLIDSRKASIERIFKRCITQEIHRRIPHERSKLSGISYEITNASSLTPLLPLFNSQINDFPYISIQQCIKTLTTTDRSWELFLDNLPLPGLQPPTTLEELVYISYVYEILLPFLKTMDAEGTIEDMDNTLILQIDNIVESKPYLKAKKFLEVYNKKLGVKKASLIGIYPSERVFYSKEGGYRSSLHKYDPGQDLFLDSSRRVKPCEVLERVYGVYRMAAVRGAAVEEGLV
ncbi:hypothetical protein TWF506_009303 [Arthrobotrys conoides]|uniref:Uncharacterized protein n=1 Tax=Arthrobotrys conoides TaxID=74498 RepID=A0AAN8NMC3_9PEZI